MKGLAIAALLVTVAAALAVLYGVSTLTPEVEAATCAVTPALEAADAFENALAEVERRTFTGRVLGDAQGLAAEDCAFVTYTVRLNHRGFFPAEWITLTVEPAEGVLQLPDEAAHVLPAGSRGDLSATVLHAGNVENPARTLHVVCYVLGREIAFDAQAQ